MGKSGPKDWQVLSLGDAGFLLFFRVVSADYGKPWILVEIEIICLHIDALRKYLEAVVDLGG